MINIGEVRLNISNFGGRLFDIYIVLTSLIYYF